MKVYQKTATIREGEWFPLDGTYDYMASDVYPNNPEIRESIWGKFLKCCENPDRYLISIDYMLRPRKIVCIGMYDGWPYWKPYPSFSLASVFGAETYSWWQLRFIRQMETT